MLGIGAIVRLAIAAVILGAAAVLQLGTRAAFAAPPAATPQPLDTSSAAIAFLEAKVRRDPGDFIALNLLSGRYLERFRASGGDQDLGLAEDAARRSLEAIPLEMNVGGLAARAMVNQMAHRFALARDDAVRLIALVSDKSYPRKILGDALLELGSYAEAAAAYREMEHLGEQGTIDAESRLARLALVRGETEAARVHLKTALAHARDVNASAAVAWCCVQLGELEFGRGEWKKAEQLYAEALQAMPDSVSALDHVAELRAAEGKYVEAIDLYGRAIARSPRPELRQALGDVYAFMGKPDEARSWHAQALDGYLKSVAEGWVHYDHHLAGFYADSEPDAAAALEWAGKDLELRKSVYAFDAMAWALHRAGRETEALPVMKQALAAGTEDAHLLYHAGMIASGAGDLAAGREFLQRCVRVNPRYNAFHVHR